MVHTGVNKVVKNIMCGWHLVNEDHQSFQVTVRYASSIATIYEAQNLE